MSYIFCCDMFEMLFIGRNRGVWFDKEDVSWQIFIGKDCYSFNFCPFCGKSVDGIQKYKEGGI